MRSGKLWRGRLASPLRLPCKAVLLCRSGVKEVHAELKELPRTHAAITGPRQCAFTMLVAQTGKGNSALGLHSTADFPPCVVVVVVGPLGLG